MANKPKKIFTSVEFALSDEQREQLRSLKAGMEKRHASNLSAMHKVAAKSVAR